MSHGHAPFVILRVTLVRKRSLQRNALIGAALHTQAVRLSGTVTTPLPPLGFSAATVRALVICSKVTRPSHRGSAKDHVATAALRLRSGQFSSVQAWAKLGAHAATVDRESSICDKTTPCRKRSRPSLPASNWFAPFGGGVWLRPPVTGLSGTAPSGWLFCWRDSWGPPAYS